MSFGAFAEQAPNPRSASVNVINVSSQRASGNEVQRGNAINSVDDSESISRVATNRPSNVVSRSGITPVVSSTSSSGRGTSSVSRSAATTTVSSGRTSATAARSGVTVTPSVARTGASVSRAAASNSSQVINASRAASSRATAVFTDISKIGGGYAECREAYATCMDQFCANANDTYRRCFCSNRFIEFRDMEYAFDEAKTLLAQFQDNNLNAVGMTAAEVNAMYTATAGEQAIKNDTSAAANMLSEIGDLLSGKKKTSSSTSLDELMNNLNFDFSVDIDDIWAGGDGGLFGSSNRVNLAELEGSSLFTEADKQCLQLIADSCENDAVLTMAKSAYNILITQDCNAYEKSINAQKEAIEQTVRTAEKYLREARLEEYRSHNSADVNECIGKVRTALMEDTACGENYKRCLDYSGAYINISTGEPIYSARLFQLADLITLDGNSDVLAQNRDFNSFLDSKKMFATSALDTCRDISDIVWEEFKRTALIEIAQAQDAKLEDIKASCVSTMADCYDTQSNALKSFDANTASSVGALSALAARDMCADKVSACASLYGGTEGCTFDGNGKLTNASYCGLDSLLAYVNSVDTIKVAEGCETGISNFLQELCTPSSVEGGEYPWGCRTMAVGTEQDGVGEDKTTNTIWGQVNTRKSVYCGSTSVSGLDNLDPMVTSSIRSLVQSIQTDLAIMFDEKCEESGGIWYSSQNGADNTGQSLQKEEKFYNTLFNGSSESSYAQNSFSYGWCVQNDVKYNCELQNEAMGATDYTTFDAINNVCIFSDEWYKVHCEYLGGIWTDGTCYR